MCSFYVLVMAPGSRGADLFSEDTQMPVSPVPVGYNAVTPYIIIEGATNALQWYCDALGATEDMRLPAPGGRIGHAEISIGGSKIMLADANAEHGAAAPGKFGGSPVSLLLYVPDVDAVMAKAAASGATVRSQPEDKFYGDRMGTIVDPFGHTWHISTHIEDVTPDEIERRLAAMSAKG
jgi:PhnB protein